MNAKTKANILVVEDSRAAAMRLQTSLERAGYAVHTAKNGREAWDRARQRQYDLVITDEQMPVMSGRELCQRLRADDRYATTPIIFLTAGKPADDDLQISATYGKPFNPGTLLRAVEAELSGAGRARRAKSRSSVRRGRKECDPPPETSPPTNTSGVVSEQDAAELSFAYVVGPSSPPDAEVRV
jgi:DNA-binding response OmpR family regulator